MPNRNKMTAEMQHHLIQELQENTISGNITKTVGIGKDFETIMDFSRWIDSVNQVSGLITVILDDGIHVLEQGDIKDIITEILYAMKFENKTIVMESASGDNTLCQITVDIDSINPIDLQTVAILTDRCNVRIDNIGMDGTIGGLHIGTPLVNIGLINSIGTINDCKIEQGIGISSIDSALTVKNTVFDSCVIGVAGLLAKTYLINSTISNCQAAIQSVELSQTVLASTLLTNNGIDSFFPLNEIQYDGGFISTNDTSLTIKA